jgi:hypothetical protein
MQFKPVANSKKVEENDRWVAVIPPVGGGKTISVSISLKDSQNQTGNYPRVKPILIKTANNGTGEVLINELMASNTTTIADPAGEYDDWVELYNPGTSAVMLTGKYLTDKLTNLPKWKFETPSLYITAGEHLLVWCDEDQTQVGLHTNFKLSASGEEMAIVAEDGVSIIDGISFGAQSNNVSFGRYPDGNNNLQAMPPTPGQMNKTIGVEEQNSQKLLELAVVPNPSRGSATIQFVLNKSQDVTIKLFDQQGFETILKPCQALLPGQHSLPLQLMDLKPGVYIVQIIGEFGLASTRLVVLR